MTYDAPILRDHLPLPSRYRAPLTPTESHLTAIWKTVFGMDRVGTDDSFRDLGGDFFLATTIVQMIDECFQSRFPPELLTGAETITTLTAKIDSLIDARRL